MARRATPERRQSFWLDACPLPEPGDEHLVAAVGAEWLAPAREAMRPPPKIPRSEWADQFYRLSAESAATPGPWRTLPYQREILDCFGDPRVEFLTWMKSARVGATKMLNIDIAYHAVADPCPLMLVQPTVEDAEGYAKEELAPMLRDCAEIGEAFAGEQTILHKTFPGGSISMVGANSPRGFRRVSRKKVYFDELDGYPLSAGPEGDQYRLGVQRTSYYWDRQIIAVSTPTVAATSRIARLFEAGDQRRYHVPCPQCGHRDILVFHEKKNGRGHFMQWPPGEPEKARFICRAHDCVIEHSDLPDMLEGGEWIADRPFTGHASFHIWAAYSLSPNATWAQLAAEFLSAQEEGPTALKTFVNTALGETWEDIGDAPDWERLYARRERYPIGTVPEPVKVLTCGVDVQQDRLIYEVVGWAADKQSWSIDEGELYGSTADTGVWAQLDELLGREYKSERGAFTIARMAVDSGYQTNTVYNWCRRYPVTRVMSVKGKADARQLIGTPSEVDVVVGSRKYKGGHKNWIVGTNVAKEELFGWLGMDRPDEGNPYPPGWCHFPEHGEEYFKQLTGEQLVAVTNSRGFVSLEWRPMPGRQNHRLDCRVYARAAASALGLDRAPPPPTPSAKPTAPARALPSVSPAPADEPPPPPDRAPRPSPSSSWTGGGRGRSRRRGGRWLG